MKDFSDPNVLSSLMDFTGKVCAAANSSELTVAMLEFNEMLGLSGSVFSSFAREDDSRESYRFINTCPAAWCQEYNANAWYAIDPCLLYAMTNNQPALVGDVPVVTRGQRNMMEAARRFGFLSGIVVPAHSPSGRSRMGVLYMVSNDAERLNRDALDRLRLVLRALSGELLDWWTRQIRTELLAGGELTSQEKDMLRMTLQGLGSKEIASYLGTTKAAVDQRLHRIAGRFDSYSRRDAANLAYQYGMLA